MRSLAPLAVAVLAVVAYAGPTSAAQHGNNGTVKIHEGSGEPSPITANDPKVCTFHIHALGFDPGQTLSFHIEGQGGPNVAGPDTYDSAITVGGNGEGRDPASGAIELDPGMYKLTTDGDNVHQRDKHKVFKVECEPAGDDDDDDSGPGPGDDDDDDGGPRPGGDDDDDDGGPRPGGDDDDSGLPATDTSSGSVAPVSLAMLAVASTGAIAGILFALTLLRRRRVT